MDVNNAASVSALASSIQPQPPAPKNNKPPQEQQNSTVVKLSEQAQQMHRAESRNNTQQAEAKTKEAAKASGIMEGESRRGRVNTHA